MTGPGYAVACRYRTPDGAEQTRMARSGPGLPHPEWQIQSFLERSAPPGSTVIELYAELQPCAVPGGNCAALVLREWPDAKVSHSAEYGGDAASRMRGVTALEKHVREVAAREGKTPPPSTTRLPLPAPGTVPQLPDPPPAEVRSSLTKAFGVDGITPYRAPASDDSETPTAPWRALYTAGLPTSFPPFFRADTDPNTQLCDLGRFAEITAVELRAEVRESHAQHGYLRIGGDFGREICVERNTGRVWAVELTSGWASFVNSDVLRFAECLTLLARRWPARRTLGPRQAAVDTAEFQVALAAVDEACLTGANRWWSVIVEQMWNGLL
ncbi:SUKH-4 family immunity protein [Streptomyces sp. NPDC057694]|uniref:SUKH-4 family immunity protein n=1 Tax=Streptomyces sp. NPDC057694 TaxID=3346216 RepID=UPI0036C14132